MHGMDEGRWLEFLDGATCPDIEQHLRGCPECSDTIQQLRTWQAALRSEGALLRDAAGVSEARVEQMLEACLGELAASRAWTPHQATLLLRSLLEPFCGAGAAQTITELTMRRSTSGDQAFDSTGWRVFVNNLSENVESICGSAAGRLVGRAGRSLAVESV
jgi:hypothetical protein